MSGDVCASTINRSIVRDLNFTYKRLNRQCNARYTLENLLYTQAFINFCQTKRTQNIISCLNRTYGHSDQGKPFFRLGNMWQIEITHGLDCVLYHNFVVGTSNTNTYLNF